MSPYSQDRMLHLNPAGVVTSFVVAGMLLASCSEAQVPSQNATPPASVPALATATVSLEPAPQIAEISVNEGCLVIPPEVLESYKALDPDEITFVDRGSGDRAAITITTPELNQAARNLDPHQREIIASFLTSIIKATQIYTGLQIDLSDIEFCATLDAAIEASDRYSDGTTSGTLNELNQAIPGYTRGIVALNFGLLGYQKIVVFMSNIANGEAMENLMWKIAPDELIEYNLTVSPLDEPAILEIPNWGAVRFAHHFGLILVENPGNPQTIILILDNLNSAATAWLVRKAFGGEIEYNGSLYDLYAVAFDRAFGASGLGMTPEMVQEYRNKGPIEFAKQALRMNGYSEADITPEEINRIITIYAYINSVSPTDGTVNTQITEGIDRIVNDIKSRRSETDQEEANKQEGIRYANR